MDSDSSEVDTWNDDQLDSDDNEVQSEEEEAEEIDESDGSESSDLEVVNANGEEVKQS